MANRLVALIKDKQASLTKLQGELADLEKARALLAAGTDSSTLAALWQRSGGAHVIGYRSSKNGKIYRRLVLWVGTWASAEELLALKVDVGGTVLLAPRRRWIATGRLARRLCQEIFPHVGGQKKERLRELLAKLSNDVDSLRAIWSRLILTWTLTHSPPPAFDSSSF